jgi:hypothetical protein
MLRALENVMPGSWVLTPDGWDVVDTVMITIQGATVAMMSGREYGVDLDEED